MIKTLSINSNTALTLPLYLSGRETVIKLSGESFSTELKVLLGNKKEDKEIILPLPINGNVTISGEDEFVNQISSAPYQETDSALTYHFAPQFGWINDPNGMIFLDGFYHLFFQYNPVGREWGNMSWGHAYSKDLVNWTQTKTALFPEDIEHTIFSGSAIKIGDKVYFPYTEANITPPQNFKQCLAVSSDMKTLKKLGPFYNSGGEVRDPKAFYYHNELYFLTFEKENEFALYSVKDEFKTITKLDTISAPPLWECPDLYILKDTDGKEKLYFTAADAILHEASIEEGKLSIKEEGISLFQTKLPYAGQSFSNIDETIIISWLRTENKGKLYHGVMALPRVLILEDGQIKLKEPKTLKWDEIECVNSSKVEKNLDKAYKLTLSLSADAKITIGNKEFFYNWNENTLANEEVKLNFKGDEGYIIIYCDDEIVEIQDSTLSTVSYLECQQTSTLKLESEKPIIAKFYNLGG